MADDYSDIIHSMMRDLEEYDATPNGAPRCDGCGCRMTDLGLETLYTVSRHTIVEWLYARLLPCPTDVLSFVTPPSQERRGEPYFTGVTRQRMRREEAGGAGRYDSNGMIRTIRGLGVAGLIALALSAWSKNALIFDVSVQEAIAAPPRQP